MRLFYLLLLVLPLSLKSLPNEEQNKKIVFVSIPKSGTHLLKKAIRCITNDLPIRWVAINSVSHFDPYKDLKIPKPITGAHLFPELDLIRTKCSERYKKILMIRDPRDVMVSFMYHLQNQKLWAGKDNFDFERFAQLSPEQKLRETLLFPDLFRNPKTCFETAAKWMHEKDVFVCRFEDLVGPKGGGSTAKQYKTLRELSLFLGFPLSEKEIVSIASQLFGGTWTFRKGKVGIWKEYYSNANKKLFKQLMGQAVIDLGYAKDDQW